MIDKNSKNKKNKKIKNRKGINKIKNNKNGDKLFNKIKNGLVPIVRMILLDLTLLLIEKYIEYFITN